jgi:hypothetical protein
MTPSPDVSSRVFVPGNPFFDNSSLNPSIRAPHRRAAFALGLRAHAGGAPLGRGEFCRLGATKFFVARR